MFSILALTAPLVWTFPLQQWQDRITKPRIAGILQHDPQTGAAIDGETIATSTARAGETMTGGALAGIAQDADRLAANLGEIVDAEIEV